jgi:hypothetical protein
VLSKGSVENIDNGHVSVEQRCSKYTQKSRFNKLLKNLDILTLLWFT